MKVKRGDKAIDFVLEDHNGNPQRLSDFRGKKILLSFYRDAGCPFCNLRIYELSKHYEALQRHNVVMIAVFHSNKDTIKKFVGRKSRPFPLLADPTKSIYTLYDVKRSVPMLMLAMMNVSRMFKAFARGFGPSLGAMKPWLPADILIDETMVVQDSFYANDATTHIPMERITRFVNRPAPGSSNPARSAVAV